MDDVRAAEAVTSTLGRLQKCHGFLLAPADEDPKTKGFIKASKELVAKASDKLEPIDDLQMLFPQAEEPQISPYESPLNVSDLE